MPTTEEPTPGSLLPASPIDPDLITALGVPLLGVVPPAVPVDPAAWYPTGRVPVDLSLPADLPPLRPRFRGRPTIEGVGAVRQPVLDTLIDDTTATTDRERLAERLFAIGSLLSAQSTAAREAFIVAAANDASHLLNDWSAQQALTEMGDAQALVQWLDRAGADADRLHAAGHAARHLANDADWALDLWWNALSADPQALAPLLASYLEALGTGNTEAAGAFAEMLFKAAQGKLLGVLGLDRSLRAQGQLSAEELRDEIHAALIDSSGSPAAVAAAEEIGGRTSDDGLVADALAARLNALEGEAEASDVRAEIGVLATRLGWLRERAGDLDGALVAYARAVDHDDAATFARRRALALGRRRDNLPLVYRLLGDLADRTDLPEAVRAAALVERAEVAFQVERPAQGRADLARAVAQDPTYVPALAALGRASLKLEDLPGRIRLYEGELAALERMMADAPATAVGLTPRYVDRAVRLAQLHLRDGRDHKSALAACRKALDAAPDDRSAFLTAARAFAHLEQWAALAALNVARAGHTDGAEAAECLAHAADLRARELNDTTGAAKLLARALDLTPTHPYVLRRAAEVFALTGHRAAWAEVERRLGERDPARLARAGRLFEHGPDSQADAVEAFSAALAAAVAPIDSIDGLTRVAARTGDVEALSAAVAQAQVARAPRVALAMAETLIAGGGAEAALPLLRRLREAEHPAPALEIVAAERAGAWTVVVEGLRAQAAQVEGPARAALLTRAGQVLALRLGDRGEAIGAFVEALENDPECGPAQAALTRWRPAPIGATGEGPLDAARAARAAGDWRAHDAALRVAASDASMRAEAVALRTASGAVDARIAATRDDLFERFWASDASGPERLAALRARAEAADPVVASRWWRRVLRTALAAPDHALARTAAERLRAISPNSLPAALALARIGEKEGDGALEHAALESLVDRVRSPRFSEAVAARRSAVAADPVGRARSLVHRGAWDDAYHALAPVLGPAASVDAWRLAAQIHSARDERVGALRAHEALFKLLDGAAAAEAALAVAGLHADGESPGLAAEWIDRAIEAAPTHPASIQALLRLEPRQAERIAATAVPRAADGLRHQIIADGHIDRLPELAALERVGGADQAAAVIAELAAVFGIQVAADAPALTPGRGLTDALWDRHVRDADERGPTGDLLARVWAPIAAALVDDAPRPLVGSESWCTQLGTFFTRLGVPGVHVGLDRSGAWRAVPGPVAWVLAPAREAPLNASARFRLGRMAAEFRAGRGLLRLHGADRVASALQALQAGAKGADQPLLDGPLTPAQRARLHVVSQSLEAPLIAALRSIDPSALTTEAVAALEAPFARTADRMGLLAAGAPDVAFDAILRAGGGSPAARRRAVSDSPSARALIAWAIGPDGLAAREAVAADTTREGAPS